MPRWEQLISDSKHINIFQGLTKAADILKEIQNEKIIKDIVEKANKRKKVLHTDNEVLVKEIYDAKKNLLRDIEKQEKL